MIIYADILIILNTIIDYFLLLTVKTVLRLETKGYKIIFSAITGGISSMYIFLPNSAIVVDLFFKLLLCLIMTLIAFGYKTLKAYLRTTGFLLGITLLYGGLMTAIYTTLKPKGMAVNNSVVYFNISPITLIIFTVIFYILISVLGYIFSIPNKTAKKCKIKLSAEESQIEFDGILDTGNSIEDIFGNSEIIIADKSVYFLLFGNRNLKTDFSLQKRYRAVPCRTVTGYGCLDAVRCDKAVIKLNEKTVTLEKPILAISSESFADGYEAIINPKIFN